jgi:hypothetical protein
MKTLARTTLSAEKPKHKKNSYLPTEDFTFEPERLRQAFGYLVHTPYFSHRMRTIENHLARFDSLPFEGDAVCLNDLLLLGRQSESSMNTLIEAARLLRATEVGDRNGYQKVFMRDKRRRESLAVALYEKQGACTLSPVEREAFLAGVRRAWIAQRDAYVARWIKGLESHGKSPSHEEKLECTKRFWVELDAILDGKQVC